jgi:hypothetical protein
VVKFRSVSFGCGSAAMLREPPDFIVKNFTEAAAIILDNHPQS